jgi:LAS superfamily LD-carboxypeptidase LdcB
MATFAGKTYTNGNVPASLLAPLDGENYGKAELRRDAAESWNRARAEVKAKTGIVLTVRGWNRSLAEQERFFFERYSRQASGNGPFGDVRWYKGARYVRTSGAPAAIPGNSNHGWGVAVDVDDFGAYRTTGNARSRLATPILEKHGWTDDEGRSIGEPWHRVYKPERDTQKNAKPTQEDDDMSAAAENNIKKILDIVDGRVIDGPAGKPKEQDRLSLTAALRRLLIENRAGFAKAEKRDAAQTAIIRTLAESKGIDPDTLLKLLGDKIDAALEEVVLPLEGEITLTRKEN